MVAMETVNRTIRNVSKDRGRVYSYCLSVLDSLALVTLCSGHEWFIQFVLAEGFCFDFSLLGQLTHSLQKAVYCIYFPKTAFCKCFSVHGARLSLALDSSICDHCCFSSEIEKTNKQCSEFLLTFWIYVHHKVLCHLRGIFPKQRRSKSFSLTFVDFLFCWLPMNLTFSFRSPPFSSRRWCQRCCMPTFTKSKVKGSYFTIWYRHYKILSKRFYHHLEL